LCDQLIKVIEISSKANLGLFSQYLLDQGVSHHFTEEGLNQVLWVESEAAARFVRHAYEKYQSGELQVDVPDNSTTSLFSGLASGSRRFPLTVVLIALNILLFPVGMGSNKFDNNSLFACLMLLDIEQVGVDYYFLPLGQTLAEGQWWRLMTPMFMHFSWLHIVFNLLWVWEIGRRIEQINNALVLFGLVVVSSVMANVTQVMMNGPGFFGGMSGVVFGLLGHSLLWSRLVPERTTGVASGVYIFMLIYLALGFTGAIDLLGLGRLANGAHLGGLAGGLVTGGLAGLLTRFQRRPR